MEKIKKQSYVMSAIEFIECRNEYAGVCLACDELSWSGVDPDSENSFCEHCGKNAVTGVENALICGYIKIKD